MSINMSKVMEKTINTIPELIQSSIKGVGINEVAPVLIQSFMQKLSFCKSVQEENAIVLQQLSTDKELLSDPHLSLKQKKACLIRSLICFYLGYDVTFVYIHCIKLAQQKKLLEKQIGYMLCSVFLNDSDELSVLLVNTIQRDLKSSNILEVSTALISACQLISAEMIPSLLQMVLEKSTSDKEFIRKKAVICLHSFYRKAPDLLNSMEEYFHKALCDKDPGVMWAATHVFLDLIKENRERYEHMTSAFCDILLQVVNRKLPAAYEYKSIPAPWLTIHLLKILALLGTQSEKHGSIIYPVLKEVLQRTEKRAVGLAIILECVNTICDIGGDEELLNYAAECVVKFASSKEANFKYLGLQSLQKLITIDIKFAANHQQLIMDCLQNGNKTMQLQTFNILIVMANPTNIDAISRKIIEYLKNYKDTPTQKDLVGKLLGLLKRYRNDTEYQEKIQWFLHTVNDLIILDTQLLPENYIEEIVESICLKNESTHYIAANYCWKLLLGGDLNPLLLQLSTWIVSKFWKCVSLQYDDAKASITITSCFLSWLPRCSDLATKAVILQSIARVLPFVPAEQVCLFVQSVDSSVKTDDHLINHILKEIRVLEKHQRVVQSLMCPIPAENMDFSLSFLDGVVCEALECGAVPYKPSSLRNPPKSIEAAESDILSDKGEDVTFKIEADTPSIGNLSASILSLNSQDTKDSLELRLTGVKTVWGKKDKDTAAIEDNVSQVQLSSSEIEKTKLQEALFSGISSSTSSTVDSKGSWEFTSSSKDLPQSKGSTPSHKKTSGNTQILSCSSDITDKSLTLVSSLSTNNSKNFSSNERSQKLKLLERSNPQIPGVKPRSAELSSMKPLPVINCLEKTNDIETDSLDGSPSKDFIELSPNLFTSDDKLTLDLDLKEDDDGSSLKHKSPDFANIGQEFDAKLELDKDCSELSKSNQGDSSDKLNDIDEFLANSIMN